MTIKGEIIKKVWKWFHTKWPLQANNFFIRKRYKFSFIFMDRDILRTRETHLRLHDMICYARLNIHAKSWVSECVLFYANPAIFPLYHGKNKLIFNKMMMRSTLSWIFIVISHWNNSSWIDMSPHLDTLSWFWVKQSSLFLFNVACLAEKQQIPIFCFLVWPDRDSNLRSTALEVSRLTITPPIVMCKQC